jgi:23S rRNA maturation-related 3'-5' exoribonuclease YhaM
MGEKQQQTIQDKTRQDDPKIWSCLDNKINTIHHKMIYI